MTTLIKAKLNKSDGQTNIDKYRINGNIISKVQNSILKSEQKFDVHMSFR